MTVEFGELPEYIAGGKGGIWIPIFDALRGRPGEWAKVRTCPSSAATAQTAKHIKTGRYIGSERGEFEAAARGLDVWARYVGGAS